MNQVVKQDIRNRVDNFMLSVKELADELDLSLIHI